MLTINKYLDADLFCIKKYCKILACIWTMDEAKTEWRAFGSSWELSSHYNYHCAAVWSLLWTKPQSSSVVQLHSDGS